MEYIKEHWKEILLAIILAGGAWYFFSYQQAQQKELQKAQQLTTEQTESISALESKLQISEENATALAKKIEQIQSTNKTPTTSFTVEADTAEEAATIVTEKITAGDTSLPEEAIEKTDRTVVSVVPASSSSATTTDNTTETTTAQKVDVYKINLNRDHRIKAGVAVIDSTGYMVAGYEQNRVEGTVYWNGQHKLGAAIMYNLAEW